MTPGPVLAGVEGGGSTFVAAIASGTPLRILERAEFVTRPDPKETLREVSQWLKARSYDALGVACFGPVDLDPASATWGYITSTPKPGWQNVDVMGPLRKVRDVPCGFDTDVNAPAIEEYRQFRREGEESCAYITVGTGIGVGLVVNGRSVRGLLHPEGGHIAVLRRQGDTYAGLQGNPHPWSLEGQCSSAAIAERAGVPVSQLAALPDDHPVWTDVAYMLGSLCATLVCVASPQRIVLSGGVMQRESLFPRIRSALRSILDGYIQHPRILTDGPDGIDAYVVPSARGNSAGIHGALALAADALERRKTLPPPLAASPAGSATASTTASPQRGDDDCKERPGDAAEVGDKAKQAHEAPSAAAAGLCLLVGALAGAAFAGALGSRAAVRR